jgi:hypothetical protein
MSNTEHSGGAAPVVPLHVRPVREVDLVWPPPRRTSTRSASSTSMGAMPSRRSSCLPPSCLSPPRRPTLWRPLLRQLSSPQLLSRRLPSRPPSSSLPGPRPPFSQSAPSLAVSSPRSATAEPSAWRHVCVQSCRWNHGSSPRRPSPMPRRWRRHRFRRPGARGLRRCPPATRCPPPPCPPPLPMSWATRARDAETSGANRSAWRCSSRRRAR